MQSNTNKQTVASLNAFFLCTPSVPNGKGFFVLEQYNKTSPSNINSLAVGNAFVKK